MSAGESSALEVTDQNLSLPSDLADHFCERAGLLASFTGLDARAGDPNGPSEFDSVIRSFIGVAYQASLRVDEGRPVRCRLLLTPKSNIANVECAIREDYTAENIAKLAPITGLGGTRILVQPAGGNLTIVGFGDPQKTTGQSLFDPLRSHLPNIIGATLSILDPGHVRIGVGPYMVELTRGQIQEVESLRNVPQVKLWLDEAAASLGPDHESSWAYPVISRTWASIVASVSEARHGGTLVVLPSRADGDYEHLRIRYRLNSSFLRKVFRSRVALEPELDTGPSGASGINPKVLEKMPTCMRDLADAADLVAGFADVDGAVVMARDFHVIGFGAEITAKGDVDETIIEYGADERACQVSLEQFGMRHRSAVYLVRNLPNTLAFVISQDGGVSVLAKENDVVERYVVAATERMD